MTRSEEALAVTDATRIVLVEDDPEIAALLAQFLRGEAFAVETAESGAAFDSLIESGARPDLVILDWMLPGEDGLAICRRLHAAAGPPVIMLTARDEDIDRVLGLEIGADAYLTKPFTPRVLLAHVRAVLRRVRPREIVAETEAPNRIAVVDLAVDLDARIVTREADGVEVPLTSAEFDLLHCFVTHPQRVLSREQLLDWTRGRVADVYDRTIDVQVSRLRKRLEESGSTTGGLLRTVRNAGYILAAPARSG